MSMNDGGCPPDFGAVQQQPEGCADETRERTDDNPFARPMRKMAAASRYESSPRIRGSECLRQSGELAIAMRTYIVSELFLLI
jgi:hypothetical protein